MLMRSKLCVPRAPQCAVARPRLARSRLSPLTVIHAAAGYGKTTLAAEILAGQPGPHAWLTLDRLDNDARRFWSYVVGAVQIACPQAGVQAAELLRSSEDFRIADILAIFVNDLADLEQPLTLVLDDFHCINDAGVIADLNLLLDFAPEPLQVVVTTRTRPDLRLEHRAARRGVYEVGPAQIAFNAEEIEAFLQRHHVEHFDRQACARIAHRTGGWVSAVKLLTLAGPDSAAEALRADTLCGGLTGTLDSYVVDEVLSALDADTLRFVRVAALFDPFSAALLDHVMERHDSGQAIAALGRRNLFIQALADQDGGYRFHELFRDCLARAGAWDEGEKMQLLRRAAAWFEAAGQFDEALTEYLRLEDWPQAVRVLEAQGPQWLRHGLQEKLRRHLAALPRAQIDARPRLLCLSVWLMSDADKHILGGQMLQQARQAIEADPALQADHGLMCETYALVAMVERLKTNWLAMHQATELSLKHAEAGGLDMRWRSHLTIGAYQIMQGQLAEAAESLGLARKYAVIEEHKYGLALSTGYLCEALYQLGELDQAQRAATHTHDLLAASSFARLPMGNWRFIGLPEVLRERGELERAGELLERLSEMGRQNQAELLMGLVVLIRQWMVKLSAGDAAGAAQVLEQIDTVQTGMRFASPYPTGSLAAMRARVSLLRGDHAHLRAWLADHAADWQMVCFANHQDVLTAVRAHLVLGAPRAARDLADRVIEQAQAGNWRVARGRALLLRGAAKFKLGQVREAGDDFTACLQGLHERGYRTVFSDERIVLADLSELAQAGEAARTLMHLCSITPAKQEGSAADSAGTVLSRREIELLQSVQRGLSDKEISTLLSISTGTVKTHLRNIFRKLGARNRVHALALYGGGRQEAS